MRALRCFSTARTLCQRSSSIAIVGSGPAGFYAASRILLTDRGPSPAGNVRIDMFERLPVPYGLVRSGVAPDHPEVKNCQHRFEQVAQHPNFRFYGNVNVESSQESVSILTGNVDINDLRKQYDAVLLTYGAALDRSLGLPYEHSIPNVISARSFVHWYNGFPTTTGSEATLPIDLRTVKNVTIIGQGNVAIDCARILLSTKSRLANTDMPQNVLSVLRDTNIESVDLVGRRGPLQLAATVAELRELLSLDGTRFQIATPSSSASYDYKQDENTIPMLNEAIRLNSHFKDQHSRKRKRTIELLLKHEEANSSAASSSPENIDIKHARLLFNLSPTAWNGQPGIPVSEITWKINQLGASDGSIFPLTPSATTTQLTPQTPPPSAWSAKPTQETLTTKTDLVLVSIGYRSVGIPGLPFDERQGIIPNQLGQVVDEFNEKIPGLYVSGWLATGPTGVIGSTMVHAFSVADQIISDLNSRITKGDETKSEDIDPSNIINSLRISSPSSYSEKQPLVVDWTDWTAIDEYERKAGQSLSKEREKVTSIPQMLDIVTGSRR